METENPPQVEFLLQEAHLSRIRYDLDAARDYLQQAIAIDPKNTEAWRLLYEIDGVPAAAEEAEADDQQSIPDAKGATAKPVDRRRRVLLLAGAAALIVFGVLLTLVPFHERGESYLAPRSIHDRLHLNWPEDILLGAAIGLIIMGGIYLRTQSSVDDWN